MFVVYDLFKGSNLRINFRVFQLTCQVPEKWMLDFICDKWQNNTNCDSNRKEFTMQTTNSLYQIERIDGNGAQCLYFEIRQAFMITDGELEEGVKV